MLTLEQAKALRYRETLCQTSERGSDGAHRRWYVSGAPKTWKRDTGRVRVPLKHGLYSHDAITELDFVNGEHPTLIRSADCDCGN